ncbi:hydrolase [Algimonas arctica]|uniref:Hydrolase n=1 Tax=Algimonas arctica TaxID=1479486 RepID=A0A8J3CTN3_9PROT|nr:alpha/beta fold hydrolase [Algimonas arctica]GHB00095.1 hydrolase [Algimonas arctica]
MVQTALASQKFRRRGPNGMLDAAEDVILDCEDGVRLKGSYSPHPDHKALVIFLHGWEGSQDSTYMVSCGRYMYAQGASVFRLNYRDHGDSHDLNEGLFFSTRFNEVFNAVRHAARLGNGAPVYIVGFSLGGNFALRIARSLRDLAIPKLRRIFAISPVVDPWGAAPLVDSNYLYRRYFLKKWSASLRKKQALYPHLYDFTDALKNKRVLGLTEQIMPLYSKYPRMEDYFNAYRVDPDDLAKIPVPVDIIAARDDGVIPDRDVRKLTLAPGSRMIIHDHGGHNGFFQSLLGPTWYDEHIADLVFPER